MSLTAILLSILVLTFLGVIPAWSHSRERSFMPGGVLGLVVVVVLVLLLTGRL